MWIDDDKVSTNKVWAFIVFSLTEENWTIETIVKHIKLTVGICSFIYDSAWSNRTRRKFGAVNWQGKNSRKVFRISLYCVSQSQIKYKADIRCGCREENFDVSRRENNDGCLKALSTDEHQRRFAFHFSMRLCSGKCRLDGEERKNVTFPSWWWWKNVPSYAECTNQGYIAWFAFTSITSMIDILANCV